MAIIIASIGGLLIIVGLIGDKGAGYDPKDESTKRSRDWLVAYFFFLFLMALGLMILGILCLVSQDKIRAMVLVNLPDLIVLFSDMFPGRLPNDEEIIAYLYQNLMIVGIISAATGVFLVLGMIMAGYRVGYALFHFSMGLGNFIILGAGGCLVAFGIYTFVTFPVGAALALVVGIVGAVLMIVAVWGCISYACKSRCCMVLVGIVLIVLVLAIIAIGVLVIAFSPLIGGLVTQMCSQSATEESCRAILSYFTDNQSMSIDELAAAFSLFLQGNLRMTGIGALCCAIIGVWMVISSFASAATNNSAKKPAAKKDTLLSEPPRKPGASAQSAPVVSITVSSTTSKLAPVAAAPAAAPAAPAAAPPMRKPNPMMVQGPTAVSTVELPQVALPVNNPAPYVAPAAPSLYIGATPAPYDPSMGAMAAPYDPSQPPMSGAYPAQPAYPAPQPYPDQQAYPPQQQQPAYSPSTYMPSYPAPMYDNQSSGYYGAPQYR